LCSLSEGIFKNSFGILACRNKQIIIIYIAN
jgi:hypothetical protein